MSNSPPVRKNGTQKIRLTIVCARNLIRRDFFRLPDPFAKILVDGSGQVHTTQAMKATLEPKWNMHYDLYLNKGDSITISIWNHRKIHKTQGSGFLGCVRMQSSTIQKLKDSGYQCLQLCKRSSEENECVRGEVIVSVSSRLPGEGAGLAVVTPLGDIAPGPAHRNYYGGESATNNGSTRRPPPSPPPIDRTSRSLPPTPTTPPLLTLRPEPQPQTPVAVSQTTPPNSAPSSEPPSPTNEDSQYLVPRELPDGYEMRTTPQGQVYFYDRRSGRSTWHDPRVGRGRPTPTARGPLPPGWEARRTPTGRPYYVNHLARTTQFTDPRIAPPPAEETPRQRRDLHTRLRALRAELHALQPPAGHARIEVSRTEVLEESYRLVMKLRPKELRKRLMVKFRGEEGLDYGGVAREWLHLLGRELFNPQYGLFQYAQSSDSRYALQINPDSGVNPEHLSYFHFAGRVLGIALFHGHQLEASFTTPFYKQLLGRQITLHDIKDVDPELHRSLTWMLENNIEGAIETTFAVECSSFGAVRSVELKPNGANEAVTESNKREYVRLYVAHRFTRGCERQWLSLSRGLSEVIPPNLLRPLGARDLHLLLAGLATLDLADWRKHTRLKHVTADAPIVEWFWEVVEELSTEMRARLLQFVTGSARVPLQGFRALQGSTGNSAPRLFTLHLVSDAPIDALPKAHTCFNRLDIPPYNSKELLRDKLTQAVRETCGFAVE